MWTCLTHFNDIPSAPALEIKINCIYSPFKFSFLLKSSLLILRTSCNSLPVRYVKRFFFEFVSINLSIFY